MALTEMHLRNAKPSEKPYKMQDDGGLYLDVAPSGTKSWRLRCWQQGKEKRVTLGRYPQMSLKEARLERDRIKNALLLNEDPFIENNNKDEPSLTFEKVVREWWERHKLGLRSTKNIQTMEHRIEAYVLSQFRGRHPADIIPREILNVLRGLESRGTIETAHRVFDLYRQIFKYAFLLGHIERNPIMDLRGALSPRKPIHHASVTKPAAIADLICSIHSYKGYFVRMAMLFSAYTFGRPGEVRHAEWIEFDMSAEEWRIPKEKMKAHRPHVVPLSMQVLTLLRDMQQWTGHGQYVFPNRNTPSGSNCMSENTVNKALRIMGYDQSTMTAHGFRSMASTILNEQGTWSRDAIERQLAHVEGNHIRAAYNYAEYLPERRKMMQWWADYLDELKESKK